MLQGNPSLSQVRITDSENQSLDRLVTEKVVAEMLCLGLSTVQQYRLKGLGPRHLKIGKSVRYRLSDVQDYIKNCRSFQSTSEADKGVRS